ncbi:ATP-dependent Clp protease adapter ClpS [Pusillimonas sp. CC-YST705]|uniref:ATP-dependent Clp protease adapter protein ClpS n=1 Tax=Mesopusillimonas faecipullorum TaxID=2755040 RepID=A0ABS8CA29_9BURK|nr:ATP-dependent Clp protease adapter ClpS [Mesopusillimonas faecipullorum]MCB5362887.1 ATP-dependent Clp protease adapter ClpS [Mesopusillimonas faecipullorum]
MAIETDIGRDVKAQRDESKLAPPPMYQVVMLNDDYTPMEFVVEVLRRVFSKSVEQAEHIMLKVHHEGRGVCGIYTRDIAATKVDKVMRLARANQHPLQCVMEPAPGE